MINRRQFIRNTALAGAALGSAKLLAKPAAAEKSLPAPITALKSMKDQARPISKEERRQRIERARELMATNKLDAMLMCGGTSLVYFSNIEWWLSERFFGMVLPAKGNPFYVCPAFERDRAMEQIAEGPLDKDPDVRTWQEDENPYELVVQG
ncbi:MAG: aminopeptidase P family protein, partial [Acidobacteria bacterium]